MYFIYQCNVEQVTQQCDSFLPSNLLKVMSLMRVHQPLAEENLGRVDIFFTLFKKNRCERILLCTSHISLTALKYIADINLQYIIPQEILKHHTW